MSVRVMDDGHEHHAVLYCSTTAVAIGYIADECECGASAVDVLEGFLRYADEHECPDVRKLSASEYAILWGDYHRDNHFHESTQRGNPAPLIRGLMCGCGRLFINPCPCGRDSEQFERSL